MQHLSSLIQLPSHLLASLWWPRERKDPMHYIQFLVFYLSVYFIIICSIASSLLLLVLVSALCSQFNSIYFTNRQPTTSSSDSVYSPPQGTSLALSISSCPTNTIGSLFAGKRGVFDPSSNFSEYKDHLHGIH